MSLANFQDLFKPAKAKVDTDLVGTQTVTSDIMSIPDVHTLKNRG